MRDVYQCHRCELSFPNQSELDMHLMLDHPSRQESEPGSEPEPGSTDEE